MPTHRIKRLPNGAVDRFKSWLVVHGYHPRPGIYFHDTFRPVVKPTTIRTVQSLALQRQWKIRQLDVNNAFLNGTLQETVYMSQPPGMRDSTYPDYVSRLKKVIYGLKLLCLGFVTSRAYAFLFILRKPKAIVYFFVYAGDLIITGSDLTFISRIISQLDSMFSTKDLGNLSFFCGVEVMPTTSGLLLSQR